jgi:hypothetical protein
MKNPYSYLAVMIIVTAIGFAVAGYQEWIDKGDWVGWIQAIGSVEAIIAAALIAEAEHWRATEARRSDDEEHRRALMLMIAPEIEHLRLWSELAKNRINDIVSAPQGRHPISIVTTIPDVPEQLDRLADRLMLLGGNTAANAIQILAIVRILRQVGLRYFDGQQGIHLDTATDVDRNKIAFFRNTLTDLHQLSEQVRTKVGAEHDRLVRALAEAEKHAQTK